MQTSNQTVVITGASSEIGRACALQMSEPGWQVFAMVRKAEDRDRLHAEGVPNLLPIMMDVEDRPSIMAAAQQVASQVGGSGLDGSANVAGIGRVQPVEYANLPDMQQMVAINVFGADGCDSGISSVTPRETRPHCEYQFGGRSYCHTFRRSVECQQERVRQFD
jgi:NAD(P)-dependent dehydrogenase (short-subunit alcohol dehydrogenase family)